MQCSSVCVAVTIGGRIDHAHHDNQAQKSLLEVIEFDRAIQTAAEMTSADDTLILVTADHAHVFSFAGYPTRGNPILGYGNDLADDGLPYPTLSYANGPGYRHATVNGGDRYDITRDDSCKLNANCNFHEWQLGNHGISF